MGGSSAMEDDWELASTNDAITLVLVGKVGYGKSATGNSILGRKEFVSKPCMNGVTSTCQMKSTIRGGRTVNVIDTPGLFDWSVGLDEIGKEIVKCIDLAKDGIHAVIMVFTIRSRFSEGEQTTLKRLQSFFGERIVDYLILVFTGGDDLEKDMTFTEYLSQAPRPLQTIIEMCKNRVVLFNNKIEDKNEEDAQVQRLLIHIDSVIANNGGKPFSDIIFREFRKGALKLHDKQKDIDNLEGHSAEQIAALKKEMYDELLIHITERVVQKLNNIIERLEEELNEERTARLEAQKTAEDEIRKLKEENEEVKRKLRLEVELNEERTALLEAQMTAEDEIRKLKEESEEVKRKLDQGSRCAIL